MNSTAVPLCKSLQGQSLLLLIAPKVIILEVVTISRSISAFSVVRVLRRLRG